MRSKGERKNWNRNKYEYENKKGYNLDKIKNESGTKVKVVIKME